MSNLALAERRSKPRYPTRGLLVTLRRKGRLAKLSGIAKDFNRHGIALLLDQPLPKETIVYVSLCYSGNVQSSQTQAEGHGAEPAAGLDNVIGVVHNCISQEDGYRCGIQFRTQSHMQLDQLQVEQRLQELETQFRNNPDE